MKRLVCLGCIPTLFFLSPLKAAEKKTPDQIFISADAAIALVETEYKMNPEKAIGPHTLREYLAHREDGSQQISAAELQALRSGLPEQRPYLHGLPVQTGTPEPNTFGWEEVKLRFQAEEQLNRAAGKDKPTASDYEKRLRMQVAPGATWFKTEQIVKAEKWEWFNPPSEEHKAEANKENTVYNAVDVAYGKVQAVQEKLQRGFRSPRIRRSWRDVLYDEDQSLGDGAKKALSDLEGALFSYTHDAEAGSDTWSSQGAIILPYTYRIPTDVNKPASFTLRQFAFAPSVTVNRVDTNADPKDEADSVLYRLGAYFDFFGVAGLDQSDGDLLGYGLQVRAAGVYATNTGHDAGLAGFEADFEPRFHYGNSALGYKVNIFEKKNPARADSKDNTYLEGQLRLWLHTEGGGEQDTAPGWVNVNDSFFRLGPTAQLSLTAPVLPGERSLSFTALYSYLAAVSGPSDHASYFRATLSLDLLRNVELNHRAGIAASYERGGLNFTKQDVDTLTLGLSVLY
jgi:hypothetical protein